MQEEGHVEVRVWDAPIRVVHWAIVVLLAFQVVSGKVGGSLMAWHALGGYSMLALVVFRVLWGFAGGTHARFASFLAGPGAAWRFARRLFSRQAVPQLGHNPLGGWMVVALLASLLLQAASGLFANDGASMEGPLFRLVSLDVSNSLSELHRWNQTVLLALSGAHVAAVLFHWVVKKENLVTPMFTGIKRVPAVWLRERRAARLEAPRRRLASRENSAVFFVSPWRAAGLFALACFGVWVVVKVIP
jgi:cytochrome b